jgi:hypothetical protein
VQFKWNVINSLEVLLRTSILRLRLRHTTQMFNIILFSNWCNILLLHITFCHSIVYFVLYKRTIFTLVTLYMKTKPPMISTDYECHMTYYYEFVPRGRELVISPLNMCTCTNWNNDVTFYVINKLTVILVKIGFNF